MSYRFNLIAATLLVLSTVAVAAETSKKPQAERVTCCMVANGVVQHTRKNLTEIDKAVNALSEARASNDEKKLHAAIDIAYQSLSDVKKDETKNELAMKALYTHLTKVEEKAAKLKQDQESLNDMVNGAGLDVPFIID